MCSPGSDEPGASRQSPAASDRPEALPARRLNSLDRAWRLIAAGSVISAPSSAIPVAVKSNLALDPTGDPNAVGRVSGPRPSTMEMPGRQVVEHLGRHCARRPRASAAGRFHGLAERLRPLTAKGGQGNPFHRGGPNGGVWHRLQMRKILSKRMLRHVVQQSARPSLSTRQKTCVSSSSRIPPQSVEYTLNNRPIFRGHFTPQFRTPRAAAVVSASRRLARFQGKSVVDAMDWGWRRQVSA